MSTSALARAGVTAGIVTTVAMPLVRFLLGRLTRADVPNERSSHIHPTVRGGGLACLVGAAAGVATISDLDRTLAVAGVTVVLFALLGLADDVRPLSARTRLVGQLICGCTGVVWSADVRPEGAIGIVFSAILVVALVGYVNAFNFMDGINGISGLHVTVCSAFVAWAAWRVDATALAACAVALGASALAFLPFNLRRRPLLFLGDVGSYGFGAAVMSLAILVWRAGVTFEAAGAAMVIYLADTISTVLRRAHDGRDIFESHREHVYQRLTPRGAPHGPVAWSVAGLSAVAGLLGALTLHRGVAARVSLDAAIAAVVVAYLTSPVWSQRAEART